MHRWLIAVFVPAVVLFGTVGQAADAPPMPRVPDPALCHVAGRTPDQLKALRAYVEERGPTDRSVPVPTALPEGPSADPEIRAAIASMVDEFFGCLAAGAGDRAFLLTSDANLVRHINDPDEAASFVSGLAEATPVPISPEVLTEAAYAGPWDVRQLADGRVSAAVWLDSEDQHPARGVTAIWLFVFEDGEWRLDDSFTSIYPYLSATTSKKRRRSVPQEEIFVADLVGWPDIGPRTATAVP